MPKSKINFSWCSVNNCLRWINNINDSFHNIWTIGIHESDNIEIEANTWFIPWKILVLLWYYIDLLSSKDKNITIKWPNKFINFITKCWLIDFINSQEIDYSLLKPSVILPFCKVSGVENLEFHFKKLIERTYFEYDTVNSIMQFLWELHNNSIKHWHTNKIYIMGQHYPTNRQYDISIYDDWEWIKTKDYDLINKVYFSFIEKEYKEELEKIFWFDVLFIILCVSTRFSTKSKNIWWLWLYDLSDFLCKNKWCLNIATWKEYVELKFNKVYDILDNQSIEIDNKKLNNEIKWTYISFTFSL